MLPVAIQVMLMFCLPPAICGIFLSLFYRIFRARIIPKRQLKFPHPEQQMWLVAAAPD
jgi:hypothetical protein